MTVDPLLLETADRAFADTCTHEAIQAAERDGWAPSVWETAAGIGLPWIGVSETAGGAGGTVSDGVAVLGVAGRHAAPIPLAESGLLARWLLASAGLTIGSGPTSVVPGRREDDLRLVAGRLSGTAHRVPWARSVERIVALVDGKVVAVAPNAARVEPINNLAGEPRDTIVFDGAGVDELADAPPGIDADALLFRGARHLPRRWQAPCSR